ncbi:ABC transporter permease [Photobacterium swingsii]|uniref:ABC transporter permease n=1 Tax=Photobacterium swingsii TaxID=680026 RepID=A0A0J8V678_9GAMM|nr:ABC transporter permease [Photobacterium swingsii]KMV28786.1 sugar ABC transporter permease [Photobacterium swingsii]PSW25972.1 ABC transporter permease [Photobacterium swingsii]
MLSFFARHRIPTLTALILVILWSLFTYLSPQTFLHLRIYTSFMSTIPFTAMLAFALTLLIIAREIDMSFPSVVALGGYVFASLFKATQSPLIALAGAIAVGTLCGVLNGCLVVIFRIPSIITTIGTQFFLGGLTTVLADGIAISMPEIRQTGLHSIMVGRIVDVIPAQMLWACVLLLVLWLILAWHVFGDNVNFIGDNPKAAEMMGVPVERTRMLLFMQMGAISALVGAFVSIEMSSWWPNQGQGYMLLVFASVFIGGTSVLGGRGTLMGTLFGACIIGILEAGIISAGLAGFWTRLIYGVIILLSLVIHSILLKQHAGSFSRLFSSR